MPKKIKVTINKNMLNSIMVDINDFNISKDFFMNYIFENLKDEEIFSFNDLNVPLVEHKNVTIQFNLNKKNQEIYYDVLKEKKYQNESEFFRLLLKKYTSNTKNIREIFMFKEEVERILLAIEDSKVINITFKDNRKTEVLPFHIGSSNLEISNYIFCYDLNEKKYKNYKLVNIKKIFTTNKKIKKENISYINDVIENFTPFLSKGKFVKVKFLNDGEKLFRNYKINRPEVIEKNGEFYTMECSEEQAKKYFAAFLDNVIILEPENLKKWFENKLKKALNNYKI